MQYKMFVSFDSFSQKFTISCTNMLAYQKAFSLFAFYLTFLFDESLAELPESIDSELKLFLNIYIKAF